MEAQQIFYITATIALIIFGVFIIFLAFTVYKISRMAKIGLQSLNLVSRNIQHSMADLAKNWGRVTLVGVVVKILKSIIRR
jgi:cell division protein FtsL